MRSRTAFALVAIVAMSTLPPSSGAARAGARIEPGLIQAVEQRDVIARFRDRTPADLSSIAGFDIRYRFASEPAVFATATPAAIRALSRRGDLAFLEADKPIAFELDSATVATRVRDVWAPASGEPVRDASGAIVDGSGIGVAVVDTGLDGLHPDYAGPGKVGGSYQVTPGGLVDAPYSSTVTDGHGTHVAGIAVGTGTASGGLYRGVAPGATLYSFNMFVVTDQTVVLPSIAFDWILQNGSRQSPPIRVVNNSWRCLPRVCQNAFDEDQLHQRLASRLAESGIVVTWSAGNDGGNGSIAMTNASAINPTPGIISVANYIDEIGAGQSGVRNNRVSGTSSRGDSSDPRTWPDVAAPGATVTSTWAMVARGEGSYLTTRNPVNGNNSYWTLGGTSMAAPHVAGIAALMLQANPALTPAEIEYILKATSTKLPNAIGYVRADPAHPYDGANYAEGHGLVHALDAVRLGIGFGEIPPAPEPQQIPQSFIVSVPGITVDQTLYLTESLGMQAAYPTWEPAPQPQRIRELLTYTSDPLTEPVTIDALTADLFIGTAHEWIAITHLSLQFRLVAKKIDPSGAITVLGQGVSRVMFTETMTPHHRRLSAVFGQETLASGDRIAIDITYEKRPGSDPSQSDVVLTDGAFAVYTGRPTASRIGLGHVVAHPAQGGAEFCRAREYCADIGGDVEVHSVTCGAPGAGLYTPMRVRWQGPAGSSLIFSCDGQTVVCAVPGMPGKDPDGTCEQTVDTIFPSTQADGVCAYRTADGARAGRGRCEALTYLRS